MPCGLLLPHYKSQMWKGALAKLSIAGVVPSAPKSSLSTQLRC